MRRADRDRNTGAGGLEAGALVALAWPAGLFVMLAFFIGADMAADVSNGIGFRHLFLESGALILCLAGATGTGLHLRRALARASELESHLEGTRADLHRWREEAQELLGGLGAAIDLQFERWGLTPAQREVALLILKGLSYKEIAQLRATTEHTVRNQAVAINRKAGMANRAEMAAFFLEDLLAPRPRSEERARAADEPPAPEEGQAGAASAERTGSDAT